MNLKAWVETGFRDFKFALRTMRRSPGFASVAALTLALGIGAYTAIFTLLDQVKIAVFAPIPSASVKAATAANPGLRRIVLSAYLKSRKPVSTHALGFISNPPTRRVDPPPASQTNPYAHWSCHKTISHCPVQARASRQERAKSKPRHV